MEIQPAVEFQSENEDHILEAIKKFPLEQRLQLIALNHYKELWGDLKSNDITKFTEIKNRYRTKRAELQGPLFQQVNEIIAGKRAPLEEEIQEFKAHLETEEVTKIAENLTAEPISDYWFKALTNCAQLGVYILEEDRPIAKNVTMIEYLPEEQGTIYTIKFHFAPNEYFENDILSVKMFTEENEGFIKSEGTEIKWKEGKDITKKTVEKKIKNKKTGVVKSVTKTVDSESFFNFFKTLESLTDLKESDENKLQEIEERISINFEIARAFLEEIVPNHLTHYFFNLDDEAGFEDFDDEEGDEDDSEGDRFEDDEDDDEEEYRGNRSKKQVKRH